MGTSATQSVDGGTVTPAPFPPETRQPDRVPVVLFTTFLRWRRYWQFGVFEIHKDDKSNGSSCVRSLETLSPSSPPLLSRRVACPHCLPSARVFIGSHVASSHVKTGRRGSILHRRSTELESRRKNHLGSIRR